MLLTDEPAKSRVRFSGLWLLSPRADLAAVALPVLVMALGLAYASVAGEATSGPANRLSIWTAQNVLGNGTHVILTFLLFALRPETFRATPQLPRQVLSGLPLTLGFAALVFWMSGLAPEAGLIIVGVTFNVFGLHHILSQSKGFWSLHHLRAKKAGAVDPSPAERKLQAVMVPLNLSLVLTRLAFVPESAKTGDTPYLDIGQGSPLPFGALALLLGVWLVYWTLVFRRLFRDDAVSGPKVMYLFAVAFGVGLSLVAPPWGNVVLPGMHGLEYYLLSARMLEQRPGDGRRVPRALIWPAMVLAMLPLFAIGVVGLRGELLGSAGPASAAWRAITALSLACVLQHYWADALIYRFRIAPIRAVMLNRLGL